MMHGPLVKTCSKCRQTFPRTLDFFYRHTASSSGLTPRCKSCVNEQNAAGHAKRKAADPDRIRAQGNARAKKSYHKDVAASRAYQREVARNRLADPETRAKSNMRKRADGANLTQEVFDVLLLLHGHACAICGTKEPNGKKGSSGWNVDHCHQTGKVRFILCNHCNRGLGAFRDRPDLLRKAADMLDKFYLIVEGVKR